MNAQLTALRKRVVEQAVINPDLLGDALTFERNAGESITFNGVLTRTSRKANSTDEGTADEYDATLLLTLEDYATLKAAVSDFRADGWINNSDERFYFVGDKHNNGVTITALMSRTQTTALGRAYPRSPGRASHK